MIYVFLIFKKKKMIFYDLSFFKIFKFLLLLRFFYLFVNFISFFLEVWIFFIMEEMCLFDECDFVIINLCICMCVMDLNYFFLNWGGGGFFVKCKYINIIIKLY